MKKSNFIKSLVAISILLVIFVVFIFKNKNEGDAVDICQSYTDFESAKNSGDAAACDCLSDPAEQTQCKVNINNANSYTEAVKNSDISACENIESIQMRETCIKITTGKIEFTNNLNKSDLTDDYN
jgi:hypothetical protein